MAFKQRLIRAEKRCPGPKPGEMPSLQELLAEQKRVKEFLAEKGLTAEEAYRRRLKVPGNIYVTLKAWVKMERLKPQWEAKRKAEEEKQRAEHEAMMAKYRQGAAACTSKSEVPPT